MAQKGLKKVERFRDEEVFEFIITEFAAFSNASEARTRCLARFGAARTPAINTFYDWRVRHVNRIMVRREEMVSKKLKILSKAGIFEYLQQAVDKAIEGTPIVSRQTGEIVGRATDIKGLVMALRLANDMQTAKGADVLADEAGNEKARIRMIVKGQFNDLRAAPENEGKSTEEVVQQLVAMLPAAEQYAEELMADDLVDLSFKDDEKGEEE